VVAGCRDEPATLAALARLLDAAGVAVTWIVPEGCCGATLRDLGADGPAGEREAHLAGVLPEGPAVACADPHCLPSVRAAAGEGRPVRSVVEELAGLLEAGALRLGGPAAAVTYHDPCVLARDEGVVDGPRWLLAAAGAEIVEPEGAGADTVCSGAGMGFELLAPADADAVAARRAAQLDATAAPVVTACARARQRLAAAGLDARDLFAHLADHLDGS
jgi:Fe-S oxidoreductase